MSGDGQAPIRMPARLRSIEQYGDEIASTSRHVGGASAAAASASLAAATAELVVALINQKKQADPADAASHLQRLGALRTELLAAADADEVALDRLMQSYRAKRGDTLPLLIDAGETALGIASLAAEVVEIAADNAPLASRFTVSDLGAAAAIAHGAVVAALLTAQINIDMLGSATDDSGRNADRLRTTAKTTRQRSERASSRAIQVTLERIQRSRENQG